MLLGWIQADPHRTPWIIGYADAAGQLAPLGYRPVLQKQDVQVKRYLFTLYRRETPATAPVAP